MKTGLVMEGGAMRGMFTAGVTDVMMENGIEYDGAIGVSAGAVFGCNYKSRQPGRAIRYNMRYCADPRYCSVRSLLKTGDLYGAAFCYYELPEKLDVFDAETFRNNPMEFYVVCTDVTTGEAVYHKCETADHTQVEWMHASAAMPLAARIVEVEGLRLLDGGVSDAIPLRYFETIGYAKNVVILTQPQEYVKKKNRFVPLLKIAFRKYPRLVGVIQNRHEVYNETVRYVRQREREGAALVICPERRLDVGAVEHDAEKLRAAYEQGREACLMRMDEIREFVRG